MPMINFLITIVVFFTISQSNIPLPENPNQPHLTAPNIQNSLNTSIRESSLPQPIRNYWEHIQGLIRQSEELREIDPANKGKYSRTTNKKYPFDLFRSLTPRELIRACREGIKSAKDEGKIKNWSEEEISLKCEENISTALEYCGILIEKSSDIDYLIYCIGEEKEEPELRLFLLKQCIPNKDYNSLFGIHFQELINNRKDEYQKILFAIVKRVNEKPKIQIAAMEALYSFFSDQYQKCLEKDPVYQAYAVEKNEKIIPLWLENAQIPKPIESTQIEISKLNHQLNDFIIQLELKIKDKRQNNEAVINKSKEILEKIYTNFPVAEKEQSKKSLSNRKNTPEEKEVRETS